MVTLLDDSAILITLSAVTGLILNPTLLVFGGVVSGGVLLLLSFPPPPPAAAAIPPIASGIAHNQGLNPPS